MSDFPPSSYADRIAADPERAIGIMCLVLRDSPKEKAIAEAEEMLAAMGDWPEERFAHNFLAEVVPVMLELGLVDLAQLAELGISVAPYEEFEPGKCLISCWWSETCLLTAKVDIPPGLVLPEPEQ